MSRRGGGRSIQASSGRMAARRGCDEDGDSSCVVTKDDKTEDLPVSFGIRLQQLCWIEYRLMCTGMRLGDPSPAGGQWGDCGVIANSAFARRRS